MPCPGKAAPSKASRGTKQQIIKEEFPENEEKRKKPGASTRSKVSKKAKTVTHGEKLDTAEPPEYIGSDPGLFHVDLPKNYSVHQTVLKGKHVHDAEFAIYWDEPESNVKHWEALLERLEKCIDLNELAELIKTDEDFDLDPLPHDHEFITTRLDTDPRCELSVKTLPKNVKQDTKWESAFPIRTSPDGNCFFHAISRLVYGNGGRHCEMRVRCCVEAVVNAYRYTSERYLNQHRTPEQKQGKINSYIVSHAN